MLPSRVCREADAACQSVAPKPTARGAGALDAAAAARVAPGGRIVVACCTSRVSRRQFTELAHATLGRRFALERDLPPEVDHPVGFPEADYLKVLVFRERDRA